MESHRLGIRELFSKKIEINSKLYDSYKSNGRKSTTAKPIGDDASELVLVILLRAVFQASAKGESLVVIGNGLMRYSN